jgi:ureidoacrylate peracid hydrolase
MAFDYLGHRIPETTAERLALGAALVVVDLQRDFVHPDGHCARTLDVTGMRAVLPANAALIAMARRHGIPVIYTLVTQHATGAYASPVWLADNLRYPGFEPSHCIEGTWGWHIDDAVAPHPDDIQLRKFRRSAFEGTNLSTLLAVRGVRTVVVSGVAATGCVDRTVRDAIEKDFFAIVASDCIGDATPELVAQACSTFERMVQPGDLATTDVIDAALHASARSRRV